MSRSWRFRVEPSTEKYPWWVRQSIERAIMNQSRTVRLPAHVVKELNIEPNPGQADLSSADHLLGQMA